jgi:hypothetical protein
MFCVSVFALLAGCAQFPVLDEAVPEHAEAADFPALIPIEQIMDGALVDATAGQTESDRLTARAARLRARAARLRNTAVGSAQDDATEGTPTE